MKKRVSLIILFALSFIVSVAPLVVIFVMRFDRYTKTVGGGLKLALGGIIVAALILFKVLGKLKIPSGITVSMAVFALCYLLNPVLSDLCILSGMYMLGTSLDFIFIHPIIKKMKQDIAVGKTAKATAKEVQAVLEQYGIGRV